MGPIGCPETPVRNYHYLLCNNPEERGCHLRRGESLKSLRLSELEKKRKKTATKWKELRGGCCGNMQNYFLF